MDNVIKKRYALYNGDCIEVMSNMPDESVHATVYSPPFGGLYNYSSDIRDMSNSRDYDEFFQHYDFCVKQINRITKNGRFSAVHCTDIPSGNSGKYDYLTDFPGDIIRLHERNGFKFVARHTIWKEPLWVRNRTMVKGLAHKTIVDDATHATVASADYLLIFRKKGENQEPISNPVGFSHYSGECPIPDELKRYEGWNKDQKENRLSHWIWRRYASSIWDDINMGRVMPFIDSKEPDDEKHVHPLQLDIIERFIQLRTNVDDIIFTPFMGVGSEVFGALNLGRRGIGVELKESYYKQACKNMELKMSDTIVLNSQQSLFDEEL